jgi:GNAT superfamily N-acetyltransferase
MIKIERLTKFNRADAAAIGALMLALSDKFDGRPTDENLLKEIIASPYHVQIVARDENDKIIGIATLSMLLSPEPIRNAYLETFVVDSNAQGGGIGGKIWDEMIKWCREKGCQRLEFTSSSKRTGAIAFYQKKGAAIYDTNFFRMEIS